MTIPRIPTRIGVISSPTGAAVQDVLNVLNRRFPLAEIVFAGVQVQGENAASSVIKAIEKLNKTNVDTIIIARGGGSTEDLWPFNDESLAYAIYNSRIPIISGVGHETDFTTCDFVADLRAPTPSVAAELAVPDITEQKNYIVSLRNTLDYHIENSLNDRYRKIESYKNSPVLKNPEKIIENCELYLDILNSRVNESYKDMLASYTSSFYSLYSKLDSLSPLKVLSRGYSIVKKEDSLINNSKSLSIDDVVSIRLADGEVKAKIIEV